MNRFTIEHLAYERIAARMQENQKASLRRRARIVVLRAKALRRLNRFSYLDAAAPANRIAPSDASARFPQRETLLDSTSYESDHVADRDHVHASR